MNTNGPHERDRVSGTHTVSSAVERSAYTRKIGGSKPSQPTEPCVKDATPRPQDREGTAVAPRKDREGTAGEINRTAPVFSYV
jgi:hypothetical protein